MRRRPAWPSPGRPAAGRVRSAGGWPGLIAVLGFAIAGSAAASAGTLVAGNVAAPDHVAFAVDGVEFESRRRCENVAADPRRAARTNASLSGRCDGCRQRRPFRSAREPGAGPRLGLEADGVSGKGAAGQPGPRDRALAFLDPLVRSAAVIVGSDDPLGWSCQVGDDEADARVQLARMPLDIGHNPSRLVPALRLIAEAGVVAAHLVRRAADRALEQISSCPARPGSPAAGS